MSLRKYSVTVSINKGKIIKKIELDVPENTPVSRAVSRWLDTQTEIKALNFKVVDSVKL